MKNFLTSAILVVAALACAPSASARDLFPSLFDEPGIETVYVSKTMLLNTDKSRDILYSSLHLYDNRNLEDLYVYSCITPEGVQAAKKALDEYLGKNKMETLMRTKSQKESSTIYGQPIPGKEGHFSVIILVSGGKNYNIVVLSGDIVFNFGQLGNLDKILMEGAKRLNASGVACQPIFLPNRWYSHGSLKLPG